MAFRERTPRVRFESLLANREELESERTICTHLWNQPFLYIAKTNADAGFRHFWRFTSEVVPLGALSDLFTKRRETTSNRVWNC